MVLLLIGDGTGSGISVIGTNGQSPHAIHLHQCPKGQPVMADRCDIHKAVRVIDRFRNRSEVWTG
jgi:hypothetical protein